MKKKYMRAAVIAVAAASLGLSSCIGQFALTKKMLAWNHTVGSKFVNEAVFFAFWILPVYEVSALADLLVINSIEFWSGTNPISEGPAPSTTVKGDEGTYRIDPDESGYTITTVETGEQVRLDYEPSRREWSVTVEGESHVVFAFLDDTHIAVPMRDGTRSVISLDDAGLMAYRAGAAR